MALSCLIIQSPIIQSANESLLQHKKKIPVNEIVGDSMLNNFKPEKLSAKRNVKVKNFLGSSTIDLKDHINPTIRRNIDTIILHAGTNDIINDIDI